MADNNERRRARLVLVHGAGSSPLAWINQTAHFAEAEAVTLPGHRFNEAEGNDGLTSIEAYARWLRQYLQMEFGVEHRRRPVVLAGHSMGGAIAQLYARLYPGELAGLVLVGTGSKMRVAPAILEGLQRDYGATVRMLADNFFTPQAPPRLKKDIIYQMEQVRPEVTLGDFAACNAFDLSGELERLGGQPTLVITGQEDVMTPPKFARTLAEKIPAARLELVEGAGHFVMQEQAGEFNRRLEAFLAEMVTA